MSASQTDLCGVQALVTHDTKDAPALTLTIIKLHSSLL